MISEIENSSYIHMGFLSADGLHLFGSSQLVTCSK